MVANSLLKLCQFVADTNLETIDPSIITQARLILIDTLGVIVAGSNLKEVSQILTELSVGREVAECVSCLGRKERAPLLTAAMVNGIAGSSLEFEEGNSWARGHPAIQMIPAIIAACEKKKTSGKELLAGLIVGYESAVRISRASSLRKGLHPTGTWGTIGAALGAGRVYGREPWELYQIANIASSFAISSDVRNSFVGKNVASTFAGVTNYFGLLSNILFDCGIRSDDLSFNMTFSQFVSEGFNEEMFERGLGKDYFILKNYFKPYPACRSTHSSIDALKGVMKNSPFRLEEVEKILVETFQAAMHCKTKTPPNLEAVRFSVPYLLGILINHGDITLDTMRQISVDDNRLKDLAEKVEMRLIPEYQDLRPQHSPTRITVFLRDGRELTQETINGRGDALNPLGRQAIFKKFISLTSPIIGKRQAEVFLEKAWDLERVESIEPLIRLMCSSCE